MLRKQFAYRINIAQPWKSTASRVYIFRHYRFRALAYHVNILESLKISMKELSDV